MIGATFCSGIGAPEMAAPWIDWRFASEIEPFPRAVLQDRFGYKTPEDHNQGDPFLWDDMAEIRPEMWRENGIPLPEIIVAGTPCQAFSIAGLRKGLKDARGNLTMKFVEVCHAIVDARPDGKLKVLWENVPGVLSDRENAFGNFLAGLVGADDAFPRPNGESWPSAGMVAGPRARLAWRVLDAQYFGVAQRRRRVFVVVDFGDSCDPAKVLFERQGVRGNTAPRREAGKDVAGTISARTQGGGGLGPDFDLAGGLQVSAFTRQSHGEYSALGVASTCSAHDAKDTSDLVVCASCAEGFDASEDGSGHGTPVVAFYAREEPVSGNVFGALSAGSPQSQAVAYSIIPQNSGKDYKAREVDVVQPLMAGGPVGGNQGGDYVMHDSPLAFAQNTRDEVRLVGGDGELSGALAAEPGMKQTTYIAAPAVRQIMPIECARLQGFPDDHTQITYRGKPAVDGPQYKGYGNSMAVPVIRWILERMK